MADSASATRVVHRVRCRNQDDKTMWADVKVVDAICVITPKGTCRLAWVRAKDVIPCIIDNTGGKNGKGDPLDCTRITHMELVVGGSDSKQKFYIEKLDALTFQPPHYNDPDQAGRGLDDNDKRGGLPKEATFGVAPYGLLCPDKDAVKFIVDNIGLGLGDGSGEEASRAGHVNLVTEKGNTDDKTDQSDSTPPKKLAWLATLKIDAVNFKVPKGDVLMFMPRSIQNEIDITKLTKDPFTGEACPPDNTDPNIYVTFPLKSKNDPNAPTVGCNVHIPKGGKAIDQGPLWWIERISPTFRPWFWFAQVQSPAAFSFFGSPGRLGNWAWRGFVLWNNFPVIWILSRNLPLVPMGSFGSPNLDACARFGNWDFAGPPLPSMPVFVPPRPSSGFFPPLTGLVFVGETLDASEGTITYAPFGLLPMTHPPLGAFPDAVPYGNKLGGNVGDEIWSGIPNIWQVTGLPQPPRQDPSKPWDAFNNPITPPSAADAASAANTFRNMFNSAAQGHNSYIGGYVPGGKTSAYTTPPGWEYAIPYHAATQGLAFYGAFQSGIPYGVATSIGLPLVDFIPATAFTIDVDQLDPAIWDTTHLELYNNPINWFLPLLIPPLLWSGEPH